MQQTPQDPNQQFPTNQPSSAPPPSSHQGFTPDPIYAASQGIGDQAYFEGHESVEDVLSRMQNKSKGYSLGIAAAIVGLIFLILGI